LRRRGPSLVDEVRTENSSKTLSEADAMWEYREGKVGSPLQTERFGGGRMSLSGSYLFLQDGKD
jgi:hypothetical protein